VSVVSALLRIIDPEGEKLHVALDTSKKLSIKYNMTQAVLDMLSRGPQGDEPTTMQIKCARCNGESGVEMDWEPRFTTYNGRYLAGLRPCSLCRGRSPVSEVQFQFYTS
jgi:hypothetical protein